MNHRGYSQHRHPLRLLMLRHVFRPASLRSAACVHRQSAPALRVVSSALHLIPNHRPPLELPTESLFTFLRSFGEWDKFADSVAIKCYANGGRETTFGDLCGRVSATAHALRGMGFQQGDVLSIHSHNCDQFVVSFLAVAALGGTTTTSNPLYTANELAGQLEDSSAKMVLTSRAYADVVATATAKVRGTVSGPRLQWVQAYACTGTEPIACAHTRAPPHMRRLASPV